MATFFWNDNIYGGGGEGVPELASLIRMSRVREESSHCGKEDAMKPAHFARRVASITFCLLVLAASGLAATRRLSYPSGLAVDAKGNLYVANASANNILIYNNNYGLVGSRTITEGVSSPSAVAIDAQQNLWVANAGNGSVTEYKNGQLVPSTTITEGILVPEQIAVDGAGNLWVNNRQANITVIAPPALYVNGATTARVFAPSLQIMGLTVQNGTVAWGTPNGVNFASTTLGLVNGSLNSLSYSNDNGVALATDANGNVYMGNSDGSVNIAGPAYEYGFIQLSFEPKGIAIDNVRGRVYFSYPTNNSIWVYSTAGVFLKEIQ
jgi:hypothetical protein